MRKRVEEVTDTHDSMLDRIRKCILENYHRNPRQSNLAIAKQCNCSASYVTKIIKEDRSEEGDLEKIR